MNEYSYEDCDGDDVVMTPISQVKCCGEWVGNTKVYKPLVKVEKVMPMSGSKVTYWECTYCKGCY